MAGNGEFLFAPKRKKSSMQSSVPQKTPTTTCTDPRRVGSNAWCDCGQCIAMPTASECVCCREVESVVAIKQPSGCVTLHGDFTDVCLKPEVLRSVVVLLHDQQGSRLEEPISNRFVVQLKNIQINVNHNVAR